MAGKFVIKNDIVTVREFSEFLAFALKDLPLHQQLQITMDLRILDNSKFSKNPIKRLFSKIKISLINKFKK